MFETVSEFDGIIKSEWGKNNSFVVLDGIIDIDQYKNAPDKVLWILKEGNESGGKDGNCRNHRDFHKNVAYFYNGWKSTYKNLIRATYGILNNLSYKDLPTLDNDATINGENILEKIALININKNGGNSQANHTIIEANYTKHKDVILKQIAGIEPNIIINCSKVRRLFDDLIKIYDLQKKQFDARPEFKYSVDYAENSKNLLINYWHPGAHIKSQAYQKMILDIYQMWRAR